MPSRCRQPTPPAPYQAENEGAGQPIAPQVVLNVGHALDAQTAAFSPDGRLLVTGGRDELVRLWDVERGLLLRQFVGHFGAVTCVAFFPTDDRFVTGSIDGLAIVWNARGGRPIAVFRHGKRDVTSVDVSPDGGRSRRVATTAA